jgi:hypothetical protein
MRISALINILLVSYLPTSLAKCPNFCSGHGDCDEASTCTCYDGWLGGAVDCSQRNCPNGPAWADRPYAVGEAHQAVECSAAGACQRGTGLCECYDGFSGPACERSSCPNECNSRGSCVTLEDASLLYGLDYDSSEALSGDGAGSVYSNRDGDFVMICVCDYGYGGPDCSQSKYCYFLSYLDIYCHILS